MTDATQPQDPAALLEHLKRIPMTEWVWSDAQKIFATLARMTPPEAAPMREDVTQARLAVARAVISMYHTTRLGGDGAEHVMTKVPVQKAFDDLARLAHTARPDAGDDVERMVHTLNYAIQVLDERYASGPAPGQIGSFAEHDAGLWQAGKFLLERLRDHEVRMTCDEDAREWYGHVTPAVERFRAALAAMREGVDRGMVERVIDQAQFLCDRLDNLDFSMDMEDFAREHAGHVDPAHSRLKDSLAALSRKGG